MSSNKASRYSTERRFGQFSEAGKSVTKFCNGLYMPGMLAEYKSIFRRLFQNREEEEWREFGSFISNWWYAKKYHEPSLGKFPQM